MSVCVCVCASGELSVAEWGELGVRLEYKQTWEDQGYHRKVARQDVYLCSTT